MQVARCLLDVDNIPENLARQPPLQHVLLPHGLLQDALLVAQLIVTLIPFRITNTTADAILNLIWILLVNGSSLHSIQATTGLLQWLEELVCDIDEALGRRD